MAGIRDNLCAPVGYSDDRLVAFVRWRLKRALEGLVRVPPAHPLRARVCHWQSAVWSTPTWPGRSARLYPSVATLRGPKDKNQDAVALVQGYVPAPGGQEPVNIVAVADGVSNSAFSEYGALLASVLALRAFVDCLETFAVTPEPPDLAQCQAVFRRRLAAGASLFELFEGALRQTVRLQARRVAPGGDRAVIVSNQLRAVASALIAEGGLATTLVTALVTCHWALCLAFGNGFIAHARRDQGCELLWSPDPELDLTVFLSSRTVPPASSYAAVCRLSPGDRLWLGTDGVPDPRELAEVVRGCPELGEEAGTLLGELYRRSAAGCDDNLSLAQVLIKS